MENSNYSSQKPGGWIDQLALKKRLQLFSLFLQAFPIATIQQVLDVGVTADLNALSSNYFEKYFPNKEKILALSNQEAYFLEKIYPGLTFIKGDIRHLPFADNSIDVVFSSAVIEHVGNIIDQTNMVAECVRVAKKGVFITTPNRWHPIEVHTLLPLIHWLPKSLHRKILKLIRLKFYAEEKNLNLLDRKTLWQISQSFYLPYVKIKSIQTFGWTSNLVLIIKKS